MTIAVGPPLFDQALRDEHRAAGVLLSTLPGQRRACGRHGTYPVAATRCREARRPYMAVRPAGLPVDGRRRATSSQAVVRTVYYDL